MYCTAVFDADLEDGMLLASHRYMWPKDGYWRRTADSTTFISSMGPYSTSEKATQNAKKRLRAILPTQPYIEIGGQFFTDLHLSVVRKQSLK